MSLRSRYRPFTLYRYSQAASSVTAPTRTRIGSYRGFIQPVSGSEANQSEGLRERRTHRLYCDLGVPVQFADEVEQGGVVYKVTFATQTTGISSVSHHKEVDLNYV